MSWPTIGVWKTPGAIVTTQIPNQPKSLDIGLASPLIAPFEAAYPTCPLYPSDPATDETLIITPLSPFSPKG